MSSTSIGLSLPEELFARLERERMLSAKELGRIPTRSEFLRALIMRSIDTQDEGREAPKPPDPTESDPAPAPTETSVT